MDWLLGRLRYFTNHLHKEFVDVFHLQNLILEHGRGFFRELMEREVKYSCHPMHVARQGKLAMKQSYINFVMGEMTIFGKWIMFARVPPSR